jgi:predicted pyridoxine 5'-phosphate oxidase superfamily flavin-nucleotide-binding protein
MTIPNDAKSVMQGAIPSVIASCSADGVPNVSAVSQIWYVDPTHIALSFQFFNKTARNVRENPRERIGGLDPATFDVWLFDAVYVRSESEGPTFEGMDMQLEAIATLTGMTGVFHLKAADIYEVLSAELVKVYGP